MTIIRSATAVYVAVSLRTTFNLISPMYSGICMLIGQMGREIMNLPLSGSIDSQYTIAFLHLCLRLLSDGIGSRSVESNKPSMLLKF